MILLPTVRIMFSGRFFSASLLQNSVRLSASLTIKFSAAACSPHKAFGTRNVTLSRSLCNSSELTVPRINSCSGEQSFSYTAVRLLADVISSSTLQRQKFKFIHLK